MSQDVPMARLPRSIFRWSGWLSLIFLLAGPGVGRATAPAAIPICVIQGSGGATPYAGQTVQTEGIVFADLEQTGQKGFFMQAENCDGDPATADGIFVYLGSQPDRVMAGDRVEVSGVAQEYHDLTEINAAAGALTILSSGNPLPAPVDLNPPFAEAAAAIYFESLEGMFVRLDEVLVVGPTDSSDQTWVVRGDLGIGRVFNDDPAGVGEIVCVDDGGLFEITPEARVGDRLQGLQGALDYPYSYASNDSVYCLQLTAQPGYGIRPLVAASQPSMVVRRPASVNFTIATFNLHNLFDTVDDPLTDDAVLSAAAYQRKLEKLARAIHSELGEPALLAVQEAENLAVLQALAARPEISATYTPLLIDGPDERGIDIGLLYQPDQVTIHSQAARQGCTTLIDGLGPDGNGDVLNPQNALTCDADGDGENDGNRLFSRPPLLVQVTVAGQPPLELWMIANHWKSKTEDTAEVAYTLPRRVQQAHFVAGLYAEILAGQPEAAVIVLGDLNDWPASDPLAALTQAGLRDAWEIMAREQRFSYNRRGVSQALDHLLFSPALRDEFAEFITAGAAPINADYPAVWEGAAASAYRSSDHDPIWLSYTRVDVFYLTWLPLVLGP
jgi:hypothetical protein